MISIHDFKKLKLDNKKISMVTCYEASLGRIIEKSNIDWVLVGDSVAMVLHGYDSTIHATPEIMELHTRAVSRVIKSKFIVGDMPFMSFRKGPRHALGVAGALMRAGAHAVKLEGIDGHEDVVENLVKSGIPVMGHLGLTPQSVHQLGGHKVQGRLMEEANRIQNEAKKLESLGCFSLVLECVPESLGKLVTDSLSIPTIGIGAGRFVDGQVLVINDLLGSQPDFKPKFLRTYSSLFDNSLDALNKYNEDVKSGHFPSQEEIY